MVRFRNLFNTLRTKADANMQVHQIYVNEEVATERVDVEEYKGTRGGMVCKESMGCPIPEDPPGLPTYVQAFKTNPFGVFVQSTPVVQITEEREQLHTEDR